MDRFELIGKHSYLQFQKIPQFRPTLRAPCWYDIIRKRDLYIITHMEPKKLQKLDVIEVSLFLW